MKYFIISSGETPADARDVEQDVVNDNLGYRICIARCIGARCINSVDGDAKARVALVCDSGAVLVYDVELRYEVSDVSTLRVRLHVAAEDVYHCSSSREWQRLVLVYAAAGMPVGAVRALATVAAEGRPLVGALQPTNATCAGDGFDIAVACGLREPESVLLVQASPNRAGNCPVGEVAGVVVEYSVERRFFVFGWMACHLCQRNFDECDALVGKIACEMETHKTHA